MLISKGRESEKREKVVLGVSEDEFRGPRLAEIAFRKDYREKPFI